jgi:hypothetical protein
MASQFDEAACAAQQTLELDANYSFGWWWLGIVQTELGQLAEAVVSLERAQAVSATFKWAIRPWDMRTGVPGVARTPWPVCMR